MVGEKGGMKGKGKRGMKGKGKRGGMKTGVDRKIPQDEET